MRAFPAACAALVPFLCVPCPVRPDTFSAQLSGGAAYHFRLPLVIRQDGEDNLRVNADYDTQPFETPMYYSARLGWWSGKSAWGNPWFIWRAGVGVVITHPESAIRGKTFDQSGGIAGGYYLSGPTAQIAAEKRFYLYKGSFASVEGKWTLSWVHVPVQDGSADLWNSARHGLIGVGIDF